MFLLVHSMSLQYFSINNIIKLNQYILNCTIIILIIMAEVYNEVYNYTMSNLLSFLQSYLGKISYLDIYKMIF